MCAKKLSPAQEKNLIEESYDDIPYESFSYPNTHPERLATIATLFGLNPPDFHKAKILEIGGAGGGNLIPIAILYPETQSLGVDLSSKPRMPNASKKPWDSRISNFARWTLPKRIKTSVNSITSYAMAYFLGRLKPCATLFSRYVKIT